MNSCGMNNIKSTLPKLWRGKQHSFSFRPPLPTNHQLSSPIALLATSTSSRESIGGASCCSSRRPRDQDTLPKIKFTRYHHQRPAQSTRLLSQQRSLNNNNENTAASASWRMLSTATVVAIDENDDVDDENDSNIHHSVRSALSYKAESSDSDRIEEGMTTSSSRHCQTCTCPDLPNESLTNENNQQSTHSQTTQTCHRPNNNQPLIAPNTPLPPPLPNPNYSFKTRSLPPNLLAFNSPLGKSHFKTSLSTQYAEAYFSLSQQYLNQSDPAYCGLTTLILILNALAMDPNVRWRGGWRWYGNEQMLLERCCIEEERVARVGITMEEFCGLGRCQGVELEMKRPVNSGEEDDNGGEKKNEEVGEEKKGTKGRKFTVDEFRRDVIHAVRNPPKSHPWEEEVDTEHSAVDEADTTQQQQSGGYFLVTSFARHALSQTGDGHFSPIAAYHPPTDSCLVLDVARFKYAPYWVSVHDLYEAMIPEDEATGLSRGWILMYPPRSSTSSSSFQKNKKGKNESKKIMTTDELEGKRSAACVPLAGSGESICPVEKIKIDYCSVGKREQVISDII